VTAAPRQTIAIVGLERIGDTLMASGALGLLRAAREDLRIITVTSARAAPLLETNPNVDHVVISRGGRGAIGRRIYAARTAAALGRAVRQGGDAPERTKVIALRDRRPYREMVRRLGGMYLPRDILDRGYAGHQSTRCAQALEVLGVEAPDGPLPAEVHLTLADAAEASKALARVPADPAGLVLLQPGASELRLLTTTVEPKLWPAERFAELADALGMLGFGVAMNSHGAAERILATRIRRQTRGETPVHSLPYVSCRAFVALLQRIGALVTVDTGPMHLGAAAGVPMVALFGPTDPRRTGPVARPDRCTLLLPKQPGPCDIATPLVVSAVRKLLSAGGGAVAQ
jgi:ADP-heptose:LPS heptosyltransferase